MTTPARQASTRRKMIYGALIVVLFGVSTFGVRGVESVTEPAWWTLTAQANRLGLREQNRGEVRLTDSAIRLSMFGMRGVLTCALWVIAMDQQDKNQLSEMELTTLSLTKLQPHFIRPWLFLSWNLSYNVSGDSDRVRDKYYYISRGIQLLAEGERQNQHNPELRWHVGFFTQHRICQHDQTSTMRCLFQMSCIDPSKRDPARLRGKDSTGRRPEFERFCKEHPQLVRRLYDKRGCKTPDEVIQFLAENRKIPSLFRDRSPGEFEDEETGSLLKPIADRFPLLPPSKGRPGPDQKLFDPDEYTSDSTLGDEFDAYLAARAWFGYAQEPMPDPAGDVAMFLARGDEPAQKQLMPGEMQPITNRLTQRRCRMTAIIFRNLPARAASANAERLQKEGWFDQGWHVPTDWFIEEKQGQREPVEIGQNSQAIASWTKAYRMWEKYGRENGLLLSADEKKALQQKAELFRRTYDVKENARPPYLSDEQRAGEMGASYDAHSFLYWHQDGLRLTNFVHHYNRARLELKPEAVTARSLFFEAKKDYESVTDRRNALRKYEDSRALAAWKKLLLEHQELRGDWFMEEDAFEIQLDYLRSLRWERGDDYKQALILYAALGQAMGPGLAPDWLPLAQLGRVRFLPDPTFKGPFDDVDEQGRPLILEETREQVLEQKRSRSRSATPGEQRRTIAK